MKKLLLLFPCFFALVQMELTCYLCEPSYPGNCMDVTTDASVMECESPLENMIFECVSMNWIAQEDPTGDLSGIYRSCLVRPDNGLEPCDYVRAYLPEGNVTWCEACSENICNTAVP